MKDAEVGRAIVRDVERRSPDPIVLALAAAIREIAARRAAEEAERKAKEAAKR